MAEKNLFIEGILKQVEKVVNLAILQIDNLPELNELEGQTIEVHVLPIQQSIFITLLNREICLSTVSEAEPVTKVIGYPSSFVKYLINKDKHIPKAIKVEGDMHMLMNLNKLLQEFELDWEELLSKFIGDPATHFVSQNIKLFTNWFKSTAQAFKANAYEYAIDELKIIPSKYELDKFNTSVDDLRDQTERLAKKIEAIKHAV